MIRFIPMFVTGLSCNVVVALVVGRIDVVFLIGASDLFTLVALQIQYSHYPPSHRNGAHSNRQPPLKTHLLASTSLARLYDVPPEAAHAIR